MTEEGYREESNTGRPAKIYEEREEVRGKHKSTMCRGEGGKHRRKEGEGG